MNAALAFVVLWLPRLWCLSCLWLCWKVAGWVLAERRRNRDVRTARQLGYALWLERTGEQR